MPGKGLSPKGYSALRHAERERMRRIEQVRSYEGIDRAGYGVGPDADPELKKAYHSLQLHWLRTVPGYRAEVRARVAESARRAERSTAKLSKGMDDYYAAQNYRRCDDDG